MSESSYKGFHISSKSHDAASGKTNWKATIHGTSLGAFGFSEEEAINQCKKIIDESGKLLKESFSNGRTKAQQEIANKWPVLNANYRAGGSTAEERQAFRPKASKEWIEGDAASTGGKSNFDNPYPKGSEQYKDWSAGWFGNVQ